MPVYWSDQDASKGHKYVLHDQFLTVLNQSCKTCTSPERPVPVLVQDFGPVLLVFFRVGILTVLRTFIIIRTNQILIRKPITSLYLPRKTGLFQCWLRLVRSLNYTDYTILIENGLRLQCHVDLYTCTDSVPI